MNIPTQFTLSKMNKLDDAILTIKSMQFENKMGQIQKDDLLSLRLHVKVLVERAEIFLNEVKGVS